MLSRRGLFRLAMTVAAAVVSPTATAAANHWVWCPPVPARGGYWESTVWDATRHVWIRNVMYPEGRTEQFVSQR